MLLGESIAYQFDVENTGDVELTDVTVTDPLSGLSTIDCGDGSNTIAILLPSETGDCEATYHITQADLDAGHVINTAYFRGDCESTEYADTAGA